MMASRRKGKNGITNRVVASIMEAVAEANLPPPPPPDPLLCKPGPALKNGFFFGGIDGVPQGKDARNDGHILIIGGSGSGKSSCLAIPTLIQYWQHPFLAVDVKGELEDISGRRALIFNPHRADSLGYDFFYMLRDSEDPIADIRDIAFSIAPMLPDTRDPFWIQAAQNILTGWLILRHKYGDTFYTAMKELTEPSPQVVIEMISSDGMSRRYVNAMQGASAKELSSVSQTLQNYVLPFVSSSAIERALTKPDIITPDALAKGYNVFLQLPESKIKIDKVVFTLILKQFLNYMQNLPEGGNRPSMLLLDEFPRFGKLDSIADGLATLRSKKVTICIVIQSLAQLDNIYGQDTRRVILDNCPYKAILKATDPDTQRQLSAMIGTYTAMRKSRGESYSQQGGSHSVGESEDERPKVKPADLATLRDMWVLHPNGACPVEKVPYYAHTFTRYSGDLEPPTAGIPDAPPPAAPPCPPEPAQEFAGVTESEIKGVENDTHLIETMELDMKIDRQLYKGIGLSEGWGTIKSMEHHVLYSVARGKKAYDPIDFPTSCTDPDYGKFLDTHCFTTLLLHYMEIAKTGHSGYNKDFITQTVEKLSSYSPWFLLQFRWLKEQAIARGIIERRRAEKSELEFPYS
jgi:type IV secretion system protein VirD4